MGIKNLNLQKQPKDFINLEISLDKKTKTDGLIKIKLTEGDYQPQVEEKVKDYAKKANIKGFRAGKVPTGIIKKMFGRSILIEEINHILSHKLTDYIQENKLKVLGDPLPNKEKANTIDWDSDTQFEFEYQVGMAEDFTYELSDKVKLKFFNIEINDKVIQETLEDLKKRYGKVTYPESSELGDGLGGKLNQVDGDDVFDYIFLLTDQLKKKAQQQFEGKKAEEVIEFEIENLFDETDKLAQSLNIPEEEAKKKKGKYQFTLMNISRVEPAALSQELFDRVFGKNAVSTEEAFIEKIKNTISENYQREADHFLQHNIQDYFIDKTKINLPEDFLKAWLKASDEQNITDEVLEKEFEKYTKGLKWSLVKNKVAEDHQIKVETEEVMGKAKEIIFSQFGEEAFSGPNQDKLDLVIQNYLSHENGQNFSKLYDQLRNDKIFGVIKEKINLSEKVVSVEEFKKIVEKHQQEHG